MREPPPTGTSSSSQRPKNSSTGDTDGRRDVYERTFEPRLGNPAITLPASSRPGRRRQHRDRRHLRAGLGGRHQGLLRDRRAPTSTDTDCKPDVYVRELTSGDDQAGLRRRRCGPPAVTGPPTSDLRRCAGGGEVALFVDHRADRRSRPGQHDRRLRPRPRARESTTMVSAGATACSPACGNENFAATMRGASADGSRAYFDTLESARPRRHRHGHSTSIREPCPTAPRRWSPRQPGLRALRRRTRRRRFRGKLCGRRRGLLRNERDARRGRLTGPTTSTSARPARPR